METDPRTVWKSYTERSLAVLTPLLAKKGFALEPLQPHLMGERFLTGPLSGGRKLVLLGTRIADGKAVVIKASDDSDGIRELAHERMCRRVLARIRFAYQAFSTPAELAFIRAQGFVVVITEFIEQERPFLDRPLEEQFALALAAFKAQEGAHATTYEHLQLVARTFGQMGAEGYCEQIQTYVKDVRALVPQNHPAYALLDEALTDAAARVCRPDVLAQYGGFLVHWDFTPQNFRIKDGILYLLDASSLRFGNKYEGWARFVNFMTLYNPPLGEALVRYVRDNRTPEESEALRLMRIFRVVELIRYYANWFSKTEGDLYALTEARITFWTAVLRAVLDNAPIPPVAVEEYRATRDHLRSNEERERQKGLH